MAPSDILAGSAIAGILTGIIGFLNQLKSLLWKIISIVIEKAEINTEEAHDAVSSYLIKNFKRIPVYDRIYGANNEIYREGRYGLVGYEKFGSRTIFLFSNLPYRRWIPFVYKKDNPQQNNQEQQGRQQNADRKFSSFLFIRGTLKVDQIIENAIRERNELFWENTKSLKENNRFDIFILPNKETNNYTYYSKETANVAWYKQSQYRLLGIDQDKLGRERTTTGKALDNLFFPDEIRELIHIISHWVNSRKWYKEKNIPWKRGWLLYDPPGTGKTALVRAFAEDLNMPIYVFSLSQMSNSDLISAWRRMQVNIPCIALIEDINTVFKKRENISKDSMILGAILDAGAKTTQPGDPNTSKDSSRISPLTFDCLLNCIDGVDKSDGVFTIITTNNIEDIDDAIGTVQSEGGSKKRFISTRPGRIDRAIELTFMTVKNKEQMVRRILSDFPERLDEIIGTLEKRTSETPAQFQNFVRKLQ